ncbi:MAG: CRISPR-associated protein Cas4 [Anaerolineales bacterium]|nr:CRISPR-associated protein Cas4 [Anaerolineales bacterium]
MMNQEDFAFRVIDLKQYVYCPRILYYHTVLPGIRPLTYKMAAGIAAHTQEEGREKRRSLRSYGIAAGRRSFNVPLFSAELGLSGELDMLIETDTELIPVDYKQSKRVGKHFKLQLMGYGRLLESSPSFNKVVKRGFLYLIPLRKAIEVPFTKGLRRRLERSLRELRDIAQQQRMPEPTKQRGRCIDCEFRRFCNDVGF